MDETTLTILQALRVAAEASKNYTDNTKSELNEILDGKVNKSDVVKVFIGTTAEYQEAYANGEIEIGAIVIITDDESDSDSTTSELGKAILGLMILK